MYCLLDSARGIYIPQSFAICYDCKDWGITPEDEAILKEGPDSEHYWEAWDIVLAEAKFTDAYERTYVLYLGESGDLFAATEEELVDLGDEFFDSTYGEES
jgi:hypothetical protein